MKFPFFKSMLSRIGGSLSSRSIHQINGIYNYLYVGWWLSEHGYNVPVRCPGREALYRYLAEKEIKEPISYLEFGVFRGTSMRRWSKLLKHPETTLHGFDSFEGLPEVWRMAADKSTFDVKGETPRIDDARVRFFKGWFNETLPGYLRECRLRKELVLHIDADLYSSTVFVLDRLKDRLQLGVILIFDEFFDREHELKALEEFLTKTGMQLKCLAATKALTQVAFRVTSPPKSGD